MCSFEALKQAATMALMAPFDFKQWIDEHRHLLKPPVGNQQVFTDNDDFIVMVVGGPNARKDYHLNDTEEFFYQLEGNMTLKVMDKGQPKDIAIKEGQIFLLPAGVPHSPQREAQSIGLVMEIRRQPEQKDGFMWFCENCGNKLHEEYLHVNDIVAQLPPVMNRFWDSKALRTCGQCDTYMEKPAPPAPAKA